MVKCVISSTRYLMRLDKASLNRRTNGHVNDARYVSQTTSSEKIENPQYKDWHKSIALRSIIYYTTTKEALRDVKREWGRVPQRC